MKTIFCYCLVVVLAGCATKFDRGAIQQRLAGEKVEVTDEEIREALDRKPQLRFPISLAVKLDSASFLTNRRPLGNDFVEPAEDWRWSIEDKEYIESKAPFLKERGIVEKMFVLSDIAMKGSGTRAARLAAAEYGADAVLIIKGVSQVDRNGPRKLDRGLSEIFDPETLFITRPHDGSAHRHISHPG